jgi:uncharacterized membrane protein HdeD (DUF308 family)
MAKKRVMNKGCCDVYRMKGLAVLILGVLILANAYWFFLSWGSFIGFVLVLLGFLKLVLPHKYHK